MTQLEHSNNKCCAFAFRNIDVFDFLFLKQYTFFFFFFERVNNILWLLEKWEGKKKPCNSMLWGLGLSTVPKG